MGSLFKRDRSPYWYCQYIDHTGERTPPRSLKTTDKAAAKRILAKLESDAALRREGVIDPAAERIAAQSLVPIARHVKEFRASIETPGRGDQHVNDTLKAVEAIIGKFGWQTLADVAAEEVEKHAGTMRAKGLGSRTIQRDLVAIKQFAKWCHTTGRAASNPLIGVKAPSPDADRRHERRALRPDEWPFLRDATTAADPHHITGMTGPTRALLYELTIQTGLRSGEIRSLTPGKLHLDQTPPFVLVPSKSTKNKQPARQYVTADLAERLKSYLADRTPGAALFDLPEASKMATMLRKDLAAARNAWVDSAASDKETTDRTRSDFLAPVDHEGHKLHFHGLRHTTGSWLAMDGENPKTIQSVMRHSSITLTMDTYGHLFPAAESDAIARLGARRFGKC